MPLTHHLRPITSTSFLRAMSSSSSALPTSSSIQVIQSLSDLRRWRQKAREAKKSVGIVPTMGALHEGHLNLVMTLFVNPTQFAPHEDLASYPRTLGSDLRKLEGLLAARASSSTNSSSETLPLVVWTPTKETMYPLSSLSTSTSVGNPDLSLQDTSRQTGAFVNLKPFGSLLEGQSRPQFFEGVATVCLKLFNGVEPDHAYFGQKDIQQALLLKIMLQDILLTHPSPENFHIIPTTRSPTTGLALSSRNAYLSPQELTHAPMLYNALNSSLQTQKSSPETVTGEQMLEIATSSIQRAVEDARKDGVDARLDYVEVFDRRNFELVRGVVGARECVVVGAVWVGKTRLIDNLLIGWEAT